MLIIMKSNNPVYWRMRNGTLINVDDMDNNHVRNSFKMLLRKLEMLNNSKPTSKFTLNGDIAQMHHDEMIDDEYYPDIDEYQNLL